MGSITVSWESVSGAVEYEVYYALEESPEDKTPYYGNPVSGTSAAIYGLTPGQTYTVWVKAINAQGVSGFSEYASVTVLTPLGLIEAALDAALEAGGYTAENPLSLSIPEIELTQAVWIDLCVLLGEKEIPVALDLSDCLPDPVSGGSAYGLRGDGAFDARVNTKAEGDAYSGQAYIVSLVLPDAATAVDQGNGNTQPYGAFFGFTELHTLTGANVETVGAYTFFAYYIPLNLQVVDFPKLESIGNSAFLSCVKLESVALPALTSIGNSAFSRCEALGPSLDLSGTALSVIGESAFSRCTGIEEVILPEGLEEIGGSAFSGCTALTGEFALPASLKGIGAYTFNGTNITSFTGGDGQRIRVLHDGKILVAPYYDSVYVRIAAVLPGIPAVIDLSETAVTDIPINDPFKDNTTITSVTLPESCTSIGSSVFAGCTALKSVTAPGLIDLGQSAFEGCTSLEEYTLPESCTTIGRSAFAGCTSLKSVTAPGLTSLGAYAFDGCTSLEEFTLPSGYTPPSGRTGNMAGMFNGCTALQSLTWPDAPVPTINMTEPDTTIIPRNNGLVIYVPAERVDAYRTKWSEYWGQNNRIKAIPAP
jgi:hypothetical protein